MKVLDVDERNTHHYAAIGLELRGMGKPIPTNYLWIAAYAASILRFFQERLTKPQGIEIRPRARPGASLYRELLVLITVPPGVVTLIGPLVASESP